MEFSKITSKNDDYRGNKLKSNDIAVSDSDMAAFSRMLDEKSDIARDSSKEAIFSEKDEKKADAEKNRNASKMDSNVKLSPSKELLYTSNRDKSIMTLAQKSAMGLNADGLSKAALMNGGMTNLAHLSMQMSKGAENAALVNEKALSKGDNSNKVRSVDDKPMTNANMMTQEGKAEVKNQDLKEVAKAEKTDAERNIKREDVIKQIINHVELKNFGAKSELTIKMNPEFLGSMKMRLMFEGDKVSAEFNTTSAEVRAALEESAEELSSALADNGVKVGKINVHLVDNIA